MRLNVELPVGPWGALAAAMGKNPDWDVVPDTEALTTLGALAALDALAALNALAASAAGADPVALPILPVLSAELILLGVVPECQL